MRIRDDLSSIPGTERSTGQAFKWLLLDRGGEIYSKGCQPPDSGNSRVAWSRGKISDCRQTGLHSWLTVSSSAIGDKIAHLAELLEAQGSFRRVKTATQQVLSKQEHHPH